jgi:hypothetical protein
MVHRVKRRLTRALIFALVTGQVLLSAPVVAATAAVGGYASEMPCADSMPQAEDSKPCPCCPDSPFGAATCLAACSASVGAISTYVWSHVATAAMPALAEPTVRLVLLADPPIKPPPII